jgi:hypothetical protein
MRRCVFVSLVEYKKDIQSIENDVGEDVMGMKEKINK